MVQNHGTTGVDDARDAVRGLVAQIDRTDTVPLSVATDRVLAEPIGQVTGSGRPTWAC